MHQKILVIEDDVQIRESLQEFLEYSQFRVVVAENGMIGMQMAMVEKPDLIICDMMMPVMDGVEVLKAIKMTELATVPFIILTAKAQYEDLRMVMNMGADDYVFKPYKFKDLLSTIQTRLGKFGLMADKIKNMESLNANFLSLLDMQMSRPMKDVRFLTDILKKESEEKQDKKLVQYIKYLKHCSDTMQDSFRRLKDFYSLTLTPTAGVSQSMPGLSRLDMAGETFLEMARSRALFYQRLDDLNTSIELAQPLEFPDETGCLFFELLDNAFKFSTNGTEVFVEINNVNGLFKLSISNNSKAANVVELTAKAATGFLQKTDAEQLEIGLSFVHELANKMGGNVHFYSGLNGLVTVVFELKTANK
jgi:DNA-binding response OmpR family regulator